MSDDITNARQHLESVLEGASGKPATGRTIAAAALLLADKLDKLIKVARARKRLDGIGP